MTLNYKSADEVVQPIKSGDRIFIHSGVSAPKKLIESLIKRSADLFDVHIYQIHTEWDCPYAEPQYEKSFKLHSFFNGSNIRKARKNINSSYIPIFLSEVPLLFYNHHVDLDYAFIQVSPPDEHGMVSLGPSVDVTIAAVRTAKKVIAQVNSQMPRTFGDAQFHVSRLDDVIECDDEIYCTSEIQLSEVENKIGKNIADMIDDRSTIQMGIGSIPASVCKYLTGHKDLGIHTEMFSDGIIDLYHKGILTGKYKKKHPYKIVSSFVIGTKKVYDFIDNNPAVLLLDAAYTNSAHIISQNEKVVAINSAIEVDLTGQVCADSIGSRVYSGVGGQMDFMRGAALSKDGKPIIALPSKTSKGESKIVSFLKEGAGVVTTRAHAHYVVTEYGVAYLHGKNLLERANALIKIAAPEHRELLEKSAFKNFK